MIDNRTIQLFNYFHNKLIALKMSTNFYQDFTVDAFETETELKTLDEYLVLRKFPI